MDWKRVHNFCCQTVVGVNFGADMSSSVHVNNKKKYILVLVKGLAQNVSGTTLTTEAKYPTNFTKSGKRLLLS